MMYSGSSATSQVNDISNEEKKIIDKVLSKKESLKIQTNRIPYNGQIIKTNVLVDIGRKVGRSILGFPAPLLRATYIRNRFDYVIRSESPPKSFKDFIKSVFANMNPGFLNVSGRWNSTVHHCKFFLVISILPLMLEKHLDQRDMCISM